MYLMASACLSTFLGLTVDNNPCYTQTIARWYVLYYDLISRSQVDSTIIAHSCGVASFLIFELYTHSTNDITCISILNNQDHRLIVFCYKSVTVKTLS